MDRIKIEHISEIADIMYDIVSVKNAETMFVGKYEDAADVIKYLLKYDDTLISNITINDFDVYGYDREYYISLDTEKMVWCEKAYCEENKDYLITESCLTLVADDCNSAVLKKIISNNILEVSFENDEQCDSNCSCCKSEISDNNINESVNLSFNKDGSLSGFTKTYYSNVDGVERYSSYTHFSNNEKYLLGLAKEYEIKL